MPMSWHTMMEFVPPQVGCVVSSLNFTFETLRATGECVLNIPAVKLAKKVVACGNASGRSVNKFETFGLTPVEAAIVKAPLIAECYANLECKVVDRTLVTKYNFSFWKWSRHGLIHARNAPGRFIIREKACSWCRAGPSSCPLRKHRFSRNNLRTNKSLPTISQRKSHKQTRNQLWKRTKTKSAAKPKNAIVSATR
jgi:hypothetical protein